MDEIQDTRGDTVRELYVAWLAPEHPRWYTVGHLYTFPEGYAFEYTRGFASAQRDADMPCIVGFPDPHARYISDSLFPLFTNRLMRKSRPDYADFIAQLGLGGSPDPLDILARSGGYRATDYFRVYTRPRPVPGPDGPRYRLFCFASGLRFRSRAERARAARLADGTTLLLRPEPGNPHDPYAVVASTVDGVHLGYVPRYHAPDVGRLMARGAEPAARVERNNTGRAPSHRTLLCRIEAPWPAHFSALDTPEHQPLPQATTSHARV